MRYKVETAFWMESAQPCQHSASLLKRHSVKVNSLWSQCKLSCAQSNTVRCAREGQKVLFDHVELKGVRSAYSLALGLSLSLLFDSFYYWLEFSALSSAGLMNGAETLISQDLAAANVGKKKGLGLYVGDGVPDFSWRINMTYKLKRVTQKGDKRGKVRLKRVQSIWTAILSM